MSNLLNLSRNRIVVPILSMLLCWSLSAAAQNSIITGNVTDANDGEPLIGATIVASGSTGGGAVTDLDGNFKISVPQDAKNLIISYVGYVSQHVAITGSNLVIKMHSDQKSLNEVVVIGYGTARRSDLTGSVSTVRAKDFNKGMVSSPEQLIT